MRKIFYFLVLVLLFAGCSSSPAVLDQSSSKNDQALKWTDLQPGISWTEVHPLFQGKQKDLLLVKIDPHRFQFTIYQNPSSEKAGTIRDIHQKEKAIMSFNGAFFDKEFQPVTLLKSNKKILHQLSNAELDDGIFTIDELGTSKLIETKDFQDSENISFALQNGPILLDEDGNVRVSADLGKPAARTALALDKNGEVIVIILKQSVLNSDNTLLLYDFANLLKDDVVFHDLGLHSVLNLDGGPSTGLIFDDHYYPEMNKVQNIVIVKPKS